MKEIKETIERLKVVLINPERKIEQGDLLAGVDICSKEYDKVIEWHNKAIDIARPILAKAKLGNEVLREQNLEAVKENNQLRKRIALIEQANRAANKVIEEEINLKTEALLRIEEVEKIQKDYFELAQCFAEYKEKLTVDKLVAIQIRMGYKLPSTKVEQKYREVATVIIKEVGGEG